MDLCENIHIHYREFRIVFSLDEYLEFVDALKNCTEDLRNYLMQNPDYTEGTYDTTLMIAGGVKRTVKNSPEPNKSFYFNNDFMIELQDESEIDEIHVHWRDYRFALYRDHFKIIANAFFEAKKKLEDFESNYNYINKYKFGSFQKSNRDYTSRWIMGEHEIDIKNINTRFSNIEKQFKPNPKSIEILSEKYSKGERVFPILLSTESNGEHQVIDGNHRLLAAKKAGLKSINSIIIKISFKQSKNFRMAESLLKQFDMDTGYKFNTSGFNREYFAYKANQYYKDHYYRALDIPITYTIKMKIIRRLYNLRRYIVMLLKRKPFFYGIALKIYNIVNKKK